MTRIATCDYDDCARKNECKRYLLCNDNDYKPLYIFKEVCGKRYEYKWIWEEKGVKEIEKQEEKCE